MRKLLFFPAALLILSCVPPGTVSFAVIGWTPGPGYHHEGDAEISLAFSLEPDRASVERSFSLSKNGSPLGGLFLWEGSKLIFKPLEALEKNADYLISLETGARDTSGLSLEGPFRGAFTTRPEGAGSEDAVPKAAGPEDTGPEDPGPEDADSEDTGPEGGGPEDTGHESTGPESGGAETAGPEGGGSESGGSGDTGPESPETGGPETGGPETGGPEGGDPESGGTEDTGPEAPETGGPGSKPPVFVGIRIPLKPGSPGEGLRTYSTADMFADLPLSPLYFPYGEAVPVWVELYFETAPQAVPLAASLTKRFTISATNNAITFTPGEFRTANFTREEAAPGWENLTRVELMGTLTNSINEGVVTFEAAAGLEDSKGNVSTASFPITLSKQ